MKKATLNKTYAILVLCSAINANAASVYWTGSSGNWNTASNWSSAGQPANGDSVFLTPSNSVNRTVNYVNSLNPAPLIGLTISSTGTGDITLQQSQDTLKTATVSIGYQGKGVFSQSGGTHTNSQLSVGGGDGSNGTYNLSGGALSSSSQYINGNGLFNQSGGVNTNDFISVSGGNYSMSTGSLATSYDASIGDNSNGVFSQSGGTNTVARFFYLGSYSANGTYNLSGTGVLTAWSENFRADGGHSAVFNQNGGTNNFGSNLGVGGTKAAFGRAASTGTYNLTAGSIISTDGRLGVGYNGTFNQTGGSVRVNDLSIGPGGQYLLNNGTITSTFSTIDVTGGVFIQNGGIHQATGGVLVESGSYTLNNGQLVSANTYIKYGNGVFNQNNGTHNTGNLEIDSGGTYNLAGGTLNSTILVNSGSLNHSGGNLVANITNNNNFTLSGGGVRNLNGDLVNIGTTTVAQDTTATYGGKVSGGGSFSGGGANIFQGTFQPGTDSTYYTFSPDTGLVAVNYHVMGSVAIDGTVIFENSSSLNFHIGNLFGVKGYDKISIFGDATLGGTLSLSLLDGYIPQIGDSFDILSATHLSGSFSGFIAPTYTDRRINLVYGDNYVRIETSSVPLPAAAWLLGSGLLGLIGVARRKAV